MTKSATVRIHCNLYGHKVDHVLLHEHRSHGSEEVADDYSIDWSDHYEMFECVGCKEIVVRRRSYFSEWPPGEFQETFYPPRIARRLPSWKNQLSKELIPMLEEVYKALQADSHSLAMMGARALVDMVTIRQVGDVGNFFEKLNALVSKGILSAQQRDILEAALEVGNAAAHRGHVPQAKHVQHVMDIVENLLHQTTLGSLAKELKKATPKRKKVKKSKGTTKGNVPKSSGAKATRTKPQT